MIRVFADNGMVLCKNVNFHYSALQLFNNSCNGRFRSDSEAMLFTFIHNIYYVYLMFLHQHAMRRSTITQQRQYKWVCELNRAHKSIEPFSFNCFPESYVLYTICIAQQSPVFQVGKVRRQGAPLCKLVVLTFCEDVYYFD